METQKKQLRSIETQSQKILFMQEIDVNVTFTTI